MMLKTSKTIADDNGASRVRPPARYAAIVGDGDAALVTPPATADAQLPIPWANKSRMGEFGRSLIFWAARNASSVSIVATIAKITETGRISQATSAIGFHTSML